MNINSIKIEGGYYIKARKIKNSDIGHAPPHIREIWDYLLREANHSGKKKHGEVLERGQILTTYNEILEDLHWMVGWRKQKYSKAQCETAMKFLRTHRRNGPMITTKKTTRGMIITISKYDYYQNPKNYENHGGDHKESHCETRGVPQQHDTIDKNGKNGKKEYNTPPTPHGVPHSTNQATKPQSEYTQEFETWYKHYPIKKGKDAAFRSWQKIKKSGRASPEELTEAIINQVRSRHFTNHRNEDFIPNPATWLNQGRWKDEIKGGVGGINWEEIDFGPNAGVQD